METIAVIILSLSVVFQLTAAIYALRMIKITGVRYYWLLFSLALVIMGIRRIFPLYMLLTHADYSTDMLNDFFGLVLSVLMLAASYGIRQIFINKIEAEKDITRHLSEKEMILKETHHRIKNNISTMESLVNLQMASIEEPSAVEALKDVLGRIKSMRFLYEKLLINEDYSMCPVGSYIESLIEALLEIFPEKKSISVQYRIDDIELPSRTLISLGIIVNELFTNIMKYAFEKDQKGETSVVITLDGNTVECRVSDNGRGLPAGLDPDNPSGLGMMLVRILSEELGGSVEFVSNGGLKTTIRFPKSRRDGLS